MQKRGEINPRFITISFEGVAAKRRVIAMPSKDILLKRRDLKIKRWLNIYFLQNISITAHQRNIFSEFQKLFLRYKLRTSSKKNHKSLP
jgi:hypothetical protein